MDETDIDARWEIWKTTNDDGGKPEFRDVHAAVTLLHRGWLHKKGGTSVC